MAQESGDKEPGEIVKQDPKVKETKLAKVQPQVTEIGNTLHKINLKCSTPYQWSVSGEMLFYSGT